MPDKMEHLLDQKDLTLLGELRKNSRLSEQKLARKTGIPMSTVHNRLRKLRGLGVIKEYTITLDYAKLGRPLVAYVLVKAAPGADQRALLSEVSRLPNVCEASGIMGDYDIFLKARLKSIEELNGIVVEGLRGHKTISDARAMIGYEIKEDI